MMPDDQVNLIMANEITPHLTAEEYMDKGEYENELKQVIGDTKVAVRTYHKYHTTNLWCMMSGASVVVTHQEFVCVTP